jgi:DNA-binding MarR family transcriptional regulator
MQRGTASGGDVREILDALRRIVRDLRRQAPGSGAVGSPAQVFVLQALDGPGAATVNELAARTYTHQSSVSVVAKTLAERGLVARRAARHDRRSVELTLTAKGRAALRRAPRAPQERIVRGIARMRAASRRSLAASLRELVRAMGLDGEAPEMFFSEAPGPGRGTRRARARS